MKSLATCLKAIGLDKYEADILRGASDSIKAEGYDTHPAAVMAVQQHLDELLAERADLVGQILEQKPKLVGVPAEGSDGQAPETDEQLRDDYLRELRGLTESRLKAYEPKSAVRKEGGKWGFQTILGTDHRGVFSTRREAEQASLAHLDLMWKQYENPSAYISIERERAIKRLQVIKREEAAGKTEMQAAAIASEEVPDDWRADLRAKRVGRPDAEPAPKQTEPAEKPPAFNTEDAGSELTYNRRNRLTRGLKWEDIADKDEALRVKEVTKAKVYPKPDYQALIDGGMTPIAAHIVKQVYDSIATKPQTRSAPSDANMQMYIDGVNRVMSGALAWANDRQAMMKWAQSQIRTAGAMLGKATSISELAKKEARPLVEFVYPDGWRGVRDEVIIVGGNKVLSSLSPGYYEASRATKEVSAGWPASQEAWQRQGYKVINRSQVTIREQPQGRGEAPAWIIEIDGRYADYLTEKATVEEKFPSEWMVIDKYRNVKGEADTEAKAKEAARALASRAAKAPTISDKGISVEAAVRTGADRRMPGEDISSDRLKETFKFKGVNFGNWMKGDANTQERQLHLNHAYDSFMDLAEVLDVPPEAMSLNGMLGVAIGAQGSGGFAAAHFVPGVNEINLTRESGAGSLAHEWAHALDHYFARQAGMARATDPFLTEHIGTAPGAGIRPEIVAKFDAIVQAMRKRSATPQEREAKAKKGIADAEVQIGRWLREPLLDRSLTDDAEVAQAVEKIKAGELGDGAIAVSSRSAVRSAVHDLAMLVKKKSGKKLSVDTMIGVNAHAERVKYLRGTLSGDAAHVPQQMVQTQYLTDAAKLDADKGGKKYWSTSLEMFARAFDAFISDELESKAAKNTYLSHAGRTGATVPKGDERTAISAAIKGLVDAVETKEGEDGNVILFNVASSPAPSPSDSAVYQMAQEGKTAAEILAFLSKASRRPFNRVLAIALQKAGLQTSVTVDSQGGWTVGNRSYAAKYAAAYSPKADKVALFTPRDAERHVLHELTHAATLKAINAGGAAAMRMTALFKHVQKSGKLEGMYGMSTLDEFVAEVFSNPKFRAALESVPAPAGSTLKTAWEWFVRIVARVLGFQSNGPHTALDRALRDGVALMDENAAIRAADEAVRFNVADDLPLTITVDGVERPALNSNGKPIHWSEEGVRNFWKWFKNSAVTDDHGRPLVLFHGTNADFSSIDAESSREDGLFFASPDRRVSVDFAMYRTTWGGANVMPAYVSAGKVLVVQGNGSPIRLVEDTAKIEGMKYGETVRGFASRNGYDAILFKDVRDGSGPDIPPVADVYAMFPSVQVKSATGNTGAFSEDPDIRYSLATNWQRSPVAHGNLYQAAKKKAASLLTPERLDKVIYEMQDKFIDLRRIRDHIKEIGGTITDLNDAYLGEELYHKRLAYRTEQFLKEELQPFFADMKARGVTMPDIEKFLHARHAPEANDEMAKRNPNQKQIDAGRQKSAATVRGLELNLQTAKARGLATVAIENALTDARAELAKWNGAQAFKGTEAERLSLSGMSNADAAALMAILTPAQRSNMDALAAKVDAINEGTLQTLERYGLMDKTALNTWRNTYKYYVPLHRDEAHPDSASHPIGQGFNVRGDASKRRTGSNQEVTNIFGHIAMQREAALTRGEKNRVMQKLYLMARQNPIADIWSVGKVPMIDTIDKATGFVRSVPDPQYKDKKHVITLRIAGKDIAIVMNEYNPQALRLAQSIKNLDVDDLHYLIPVVSKATRWFSSINTQYNPIFGLINFARDVQTAALNLSTTAIAGKQKEVFKDTMSILGEIVKNKGRMPTAGKWAPIYKEFNEVGGTTGYRDLLLTAEDRSKAVADEIKALDRGKASQAAHAVAGWLSDYNEAMENATRLAAYKAAIDSGMSKERAASLAKNLTVNFNRKGRQTRELGALYAFFNAAVQGTARMAQTLSGPAGKKIMLGGVLAGAASAMAGIAAMGGGDGEDDEWSKIPEFVKERSFIIPAGKDKYIAIPMPLGFHFLPNIGRLMVEMAVYKDKTLGKQMASLFTVLADAFNPLGGSAPPMQIIAPTVMDPFIALAQNKDWTGKPIYVENFNSLNPQPGATRAKDSATPIAKGLSDAINAVTGGTKYVPGGFSPTPDQIDYVIGQLTGGVGREIGKLSSTIANPFTGDELPAHKIPLLGRLYGSTAGATGQAGKFYENIKRANEVENELKGRRKDGRGVDDYLQENPKAVELAARGNAAERQIRALRQMRSRIVEAGGTDAASKARQINERMATVMRGFNMQAERMQ